MTAGRPKEYDRSKIGDDLIQWAKNNPDCLTVPHFATSIGLNSQILINWTKEDEEFRVKYIQAKELIGLNRLKATRIEDESVQKRLDKSIYMQTLHHFDYDTKHDVRDDKKYESSLRKEEESSKQISHTIVVSNDLSAGSNIPTSLISMPGDKSSK